MQRVLPVLHYALGPGGFLLLGSSESVGVFPGFTAVNARHRIYHKNAGAGGPPVDFGP